MKNTELQIAELLGQHSDEIADLAQTLRRYLKKETKPTYELVARSGQSLNIGYGFTPKAWDCFSAIIVYRRHINISFPSGASLTDPGGLLHGTGARVRHLKIRQLEDLQTPEAKDLLLVARSNALDLVDSGVKRQRAITTMVKTPNKS